MVRRTIRVLTDLFVLVSLVSFNLKSVHGEKKLEVHRVIVGPGLHFDPRELEINVGATVVFVWVEGSAGNPLPHTVTESLGSADEEICSRKEKGFHSKLLLSPAKWNHTFIEVGEVPYHCETTTGNCQGGMHGIITVVESGAVSKKPSKIRGQEVDAKTVKAAETKLHKQLGKGTPTIGPNL